MAKDEHDDYYRSPQQGVIQIERKTLGDWIVWNWRTASWDVHKDKMTIVTWYEEAAPMTEEMWNSLKPGKEQ